MADTPSVSKRRLEVSGRALIGVIGGYCLASLLAAALALALTDGREGSLWGTMAGYPAYVAAIIASFGVGSVRRLMLWFLGLSVFFCIIIALCKAGVA